MYVLRTRGRGATSCGGVRESTDRCECDMWLTLDKEGTHDNQLMGEGAAWTRGSVISGWSVDKEGGPDRLMGSARGARKSGARYPGSAIMLVESWTRGGGAGGCSERHVR